jgi:hypothetical protein
VAAPSWLDRVLAHFIADARVGGVGGRDRCHEGTGFDDRRRRVVGRLQWWGRAIGNHHLGFGAARKVDWLKGANMSFRAAAVRGIWFDTRLRGSGAQAGDDLAFSLAVAGEGWTLVYDPAALMHHYPAADQLRCYVVRNGLDDPQLFAETCFNHSLTLWGRMGGARRAVYLVWASAIGVSTYPGLLQAVRFWWRGDRAAWRKFRLNLAAVFEVVGLAWSERAVPATFLNTPKVG